MEPERHQPPGQAAAAARSIALQMHEERGRGAVLVGVARVDAALENLLQAVPYFLQTDSAQLRQRDRTCFSSSCAMRLETLRPGTLSGANGDDAYPAVVQRHGDPTEATAQISALAHRGIPVPCGTLLRGTVLRPGGGSHWLVVIGHEPRHVIVHDPWGEPNLPSDAALNGNRRQLHFYRENDRCAGLRLRPRWMVEPIGGGAYRHGPSISSPRTYVCPEAQGVAMSTTIQLDPRIDARLEELAGLTGRSKDFYLRELIQQGMDELEDAYLGELEAERIRHGESGTRSLDAVAAELGLDE